MSKFMLADVKSTEWRPLESPFSTAKTILPLIETKSMEF